MRRYGDLVEERGDAEGKGHRRKCDRDVEDQTYWIPGAWSFDETRLMIYDGAWFIMFLVLMEIP